MFEGVTFSRHSVRRGVVGAAPGAVLGEMLFSSACYLARCIQHLLGEAACWCSAGRTASPKPAFRSLGWGRGVGSGGELPGKGPRSKGLAHGVPMVEFRRLLGRKQLWTSG